MDGDSESKHAKGRVGTAKSSGRKNAKPFPIILHNLLDDAKANGNDDIVSFLPDGKKFTIHKQNEFVSKIMPQYFKTKRIESFQRQLLMYGFTRIVPYGHSITACYYHELFVRGKKAVSLRITRRQRQSSVLLRERGGAGTPKVAISNRLGREIPEALQQQQQHYLANLLLSPGVQSSAATSQSGVLMVKSTRTGGSNSMLTDQPHISNSREQELSTQLQAIALTSAMRQPHLLSSQRQVPNFGSTSSSMQPLLCDALPHPAILMSGAAMTGLTSNLPLSQDHFEARLRHTAMSAFYYRTAASLLSDAPSLRASSVCLLDAALYCHATLRNKGRQQQQQEQPSWAFL